MLQTFTRTPPAPRLDRLEAALVPLIDGPFLVWPILREGVLVVDVDKPTAWTGQQISDVQAAVTTAVAATPQLLREWAVDAYDPLELAVLRVLLDEVNVLRTELNVLRSKVAPPLTPPLPMRTEAQVRAAVRTKAGLAS